eukprot:COSAG01_NODE_22909_length_836_cov_1.191316_1_plen_76_part_10
MGPASTAAMLARRRKLPAMLEPPYLMTEVPRARKDLETSVVLKVSARHATLLPITACTAITSDGGETRESVGRQIP